MRLRRFIPVLVIAAGLCVYHNSLRAGFFFDDEYHILENRHIRHLWPPWEVLTHSSRPVVHLSLAVNYALGGLNPWGYHLFNVGVHILVGLALFGVARLTFVSEALKPRFGGAAEWLAAVISLIWLVHPLQTESVTYTIQRGESLMGLFYLLTLYCVIRSSGRSRSGWWRAGAVAGCALGMATKPVMVTAPVMVFLYDRAFLTKSWRDVVRRRWTLYACLTATWLLLPLVLANAPVEWNDTAGFAYKGILPLQYALTQSGVILHYLRLAFWPRPLCMDYGWQYGWPAAQTVEDVLVEVTVIFALLAATVWAWWRNPAAGFLGVWFFVILAPTSSFVPVADLVVEHRMYLPLAAVAAMVTVGGFVLVEDVLKARLRVRKTLECGVSGTLVLLLAILTVQRNRDYSSELTIWQDTVAKCPNNPRAHDGLGNALVRLGRPDQAIGQYQRALQIRPDDAEGHNNLARLLLDRGEKEEALNHLEQAVRLVPTNAQYHKNLGVVLLQSGRAMESIEQFERALLLDPDYPRAHDGLGNAFLRLGKMTEAIAQYEQAIQLEPDNADAHHDLGNALLRQGKPEQAITQYRQALQITPNNTEWQYNLANSLLLLGKTPQAIAQYQQTLQIAPDNAEARSKLAAVLVATGKPQEALNQLELALRIKPDLAEAQNNLAWLLATLPPAQGGDPVRAVSLAQRACERTGNHAAGDLDTLAVAYAAAGRYDEAVATAQTAIELARAARQPKLVAEIEARLQLYRSGRAYRERVANSP